MPAAPRPVTRLVVKVGTSVLTDARGRLLPGRLRRLAGQVARCCREQRQVIVVTSGAVACGMAAFGLRARPKGLAQLQACAAVGQGKLMHRYTTLFRRRGLLTAQVLLTQEDLADRSRFRNAKQTLLTLLHRRVVPIVNENDTVSVEEITFGDNDRLAALVAAAVDAHLLIILSDVDGLYRDGRLVDRVDAVDQSVRAAVRDAGRALTKGGMASKLEAARIVGHGGIPMVLANGARPTVLTDVLAGRPAGTLFAPPPNRLRATQWWLAFALRRPQGAVTIDDGAAAAVVGQRRSLLASGVAGVRGPFAAGAYVAVLDRKGREVARGVCRLSSEQLGRIQGLRSAEAARSLGVARVPEVIHRDHLVILEDVAHG